MAIHAGIGCFLAYIGFQSSEGIGVVTADGATLSTLGTLTEASLQTCFLVENDTG